MPWQCGERSRRQSDRPQNQTSVETILRIAVESESRQAVEQFTRELMPLVTAGPQGTTGYGEGRPRIHGVIRYWPCLIESARVSPQVDFSARADTIMDRESPGVWPPPVVG